MIDAGWEAQLRLSFVRDGARTTLGERRHHGPLRVQRPFYPEGEAVCHVYVLHPPGGLVSGDRLRVDVEVEAGARALLTTPAAGKLYRSSGSRALQRQRLRAAQGACLEWLPQETIAFDGARAELATQIELAAGACFLGWEMLCLGRPAAGERFERGELAQSIELWREGRPQCIERGSYAGGSAVLNAAWGLAGRPVVGTLLCSAPGCGSHIELAQQQLAERVVLPALAAVSGWDDLLIARYLGPSVEQARDLFAGLWSALRPAVFGLPASAPRIWRT